MAEKVGQIAKVPEVKQSNSNSQVRRTEHLQSMDTPVDRILFLQRTAGNQAVSRLIKSGALQAKLRIGQPGDKYEQEADRVADAVMRMPEPGVQRQVEPEEEEEKVLQTKPLVDQITPLVQRQVEEEEEEEMLQAKSTEDATPEVPNDLESQINAIKGGGRPLAESERAYFEPRFGADFGNVRLHTGAQAAESAQAVNAKAYTLERDVVFGAGHYAPGTSEGRRLMAHELTHVVQQHNSKNPYMARLNDAWLPGMRPTLPPAPDPTSPIEVTVIDDSDRVGWLAGFTRTGEVYMTNVTTMVDNVLQALDRHCILRLNILDHGNQNGIEIGNDWITTQSIAQYRPVLARLSGRFAANGFVHIQHCNAGQNLDLVRALAAIFGVSVYAGTGAHNPLYRFNFGDYVRCDTNRHCDNDVGRP